MSEWKEYQLSEMKKIATIEVKSNGK